MLTGKCPQCGCTGIHACMGAPGTPMTAQQLARLEDAIMDIMETEERRETMILTKKQIEHLATYAGFKVQDISGSSDSTEFVIREGTIAAPDGTEDYNGLLAHDRDYPEDGAIPLE